MKHIFIFSILMMAIVSTKAQNLTILYKETKNFGAGQTQYFNLNTTNEFSYYEEVDLSKINEKNTIEDKVNDRGSNTRTRKTVIGRKDLTPQFVYSNPSLEHIYYLENFADRLLFVRDDYELKWEITNETKKINNFNCKKATTSFRGRIYTAWYTSEIPTKYGPWKFKNLPGLILEVSDTKKEFVIRAIEIIKRGATFKLNPILKEKSKFISIDQYVIKKDEIIDEEYRKLANRLPEGVTLPVRNKNCKDCRFGIETFN